MKLLPDAQTVPIICTHSTAPYEIRPDLIPFVEVAKHVIDCPAS